MFTATFCYDVDRKRFRNRFCVEFHIKAEIKNLVVALSVRALVDNVIYNYNNQFYF